MIRHLSRLVLLLAVALLLPGCLCAVFCRTPAPESPPRLTRDTPQEAVDFLVDSFENRRIQDIYTSLHPEFVESNGDFSAGEFTALYNEYEADFLADASTLSVADRSQVAYGTSGQVAGITLAGGGARITLYFKNRPAYRVVLKDPDVGAIPGTLISMTDAVAVQGDVVGVVQPLSLQGIPGVRPGEVKRIELHDDWLLWAIQDPEGIRFLDRIEALLQE